MSPLELTQDSELNPNENVAQTVSEETTEATVETESVQEEQIVALSEQPETPEDAETSTINQTDYNNLSKDELIAELKTIISKDINDVRNEVELIKQSFYKKIKLEAEELKSEFLASGGEENDFIAPKNDSEDTFKALLNEYKARKAQFINQLEKEKETNLLQKQHVLAQMKSLVESNDDVSQHINEFKALQQKWKSIGQVSLAATNEIWKQYNLYQETFWDLIKINNELREYDFKKNLEIKTRLCDSAEKLSEEEDIVSAFKQLQKLHEEWHETGPIARELREQVWNRFKEASSLINKKHHGHFETIKQMEEENLKAKTALCEQVEAIEFAGLNSFKSWDDLTKKYLELQEEWKAIGFAPKKVNQKLFERFRKACDSFFSAKNQYFTEAKAVLTQNTDKKRALVEKAEALKDSQDWKVTGDVMIKLQKEWKTIGPALKKNSDELWKRFIGACDYFFEQKNQFANQPKAEEVANLNAKKEIIEKINNLAISENPSQAANELKELVAQWNTIGHVPFEQKDEIYKEFRAASNTQYKALNIDSANRRMENFKTNLKDMSNKGDNKLYRERDKLMKAYEHLRSEIATYENNIGFLSSNSKKGSSIIRDMERKIETLKEECTLIEEKINLIDQNL